MSNGCRGNYLRVRGEYPAGWYAYTFFRELPPRARRILMFEQIKHYSYRNYLRVRGEYSTTTVFNHGQEELPPRARRIRHSHPPRWLREGTTSACAENTLCGFW